MKTLLPTTVVGSYPQPAWLVDHAALKARRVPRVHAPEIWRVAPELLEAAQDDATRLAVRDMELAGIDIVTDGEIRRESYSNRFALSLEGVDADNPGEVPNRDGGTALVPRVTGPIRRTGPVEVRDMRFLAASTDRAKKITLPGPFTMAQQAKNEFYGDDEEMAFAFADAANAEAKDLLAAGADVIQFDEPWLQARPDPARRYGVGAINRALAGLPADTILHVCFGYAAVVGSKVGSKAGGYSVLPQLAATTAGAISIEAAQPHLDLGVLRELAGKTVLLGVLDLGTETVESAATVAERVRAGLRYIAADRLVPAPDCGMKYLSRASAFGKLKALAEGAAIVRQELTGRA